MHVETEKNLGPICKKVSAEWKEKAVYIQQHAWDKIISSIGLLGFEFPRKEQSF